MGMGMVGDSTAISSNTAISSKAEMGEETEMGEKEEGRRHATRNATFLMISAALGSGVLTLPSACGDAGYTTAILAFLLAASISSITRHVQAMHIASSSGVLKVARVKLMRSDASHDT